MDTINLNSPQAEQQLDNQAPRPANPVNPVRQGGIPVPPPPAPRNRQSVPPMPGQRPAPQTGGNDTGKKVAVAVGAAAVAGGATAATMSVLDAEEEISLDDQIVDAGAQLITDAGHPQAEPEQPSAPAVQNNVGTPAGNGGGQAPTAPTAPSTPAIDIPDPEPDPIPDPDPDPIPDPDPDPEIDPEPVIYPDDTIEIEDPEDIDTIADSLIAQEQIDPEDIEDENIFTFNGVETVYTVDGDEETHASFTSNTGYDLVMIDIDNDGLFDKIETPDGQFVEDAAQYGLTVSDAENMAQGTGYMAQNEAEIEHFDETLGDDYLDDIIEV